MQHETKNTQDSHGIFAAATGVFLFCFLLVAMFQSSALLTLSYDLGPGTINEQVVQLAESWHGWMQSLGTAGFTEMLEEIVESLHESPIV